MVGAVRAHLNTLFVKQLYTATAVHFTATAVHFTATAVHFLH